MLEVLKELTDILPLHDSGHVSSITDVDNNTGLSNSSTVKSPLIEHPLKSLTLKLWIPAHIPVRFKFGSVRLSSV